MKKVRQEDNVSASSQNEPSTVTCTQLEDDHPDAALNNGFTGDSVTGHADSLSVPVERSVSNDSFVVLPPEQGDLSVGGLLEQPCLSPGKPSQDAATVVTSQTLDSKPVTDGQHNDVSSQGDDQSPPSTQQVMCLESVKAAKKPEQGMYM